MFVRGANPVWFFVDLDGNPLNDEYFAFFLTNTFPYIPQNVYRDNNGDTVWTGDIVQFEPNGTLPNNLYFNPDLVYRIEIRHGNTQADQLIYEINDYVPENMSGGGGNETELLNADNQISNTQFAQISFVSPLTITSPGTYNISPGWQLILTGIGTTTLTQLSFSGDQNITGNPPYALRIDNNGWTEAYLIQRFVGNGALWANGAISMSVAARAQGTPETITLIYAPSVPGTPQQIATAVLGTGNYTVISGAIDLDPSTNSNTGDDAYVDMRITLPTTGIVDLTNVQVVGQESALPLVVTQPPYQEETPERQVDHLFHYYAPSLIMKPKASILTGWNFPLNPYQFITTTVTTVANQTQYIADQTIIHQEATSQVATGKAAAAQRGGLTVQAVTSATTTRFALIEYIDPSTIAPYWSYLVSSLVRARIFTSHATSVGIKMRLIYRTDLPATISAVNPVLSWAGVDPVFAAGWTAIAPLNDPTYILPNAYDAVEGNNSYPAFSFNRFQLPNASTANMTLAIVLYTTANLDSSTGTEDSIVFDKISLTPNEFAIDSNPITFDECLRACQFYYESSYNQGVLPGAVSALGIQNMSLPVITDGSTTSCYPKRIYQPFKQVKRAAPTVTFYTPGGTVDNVSGGVVDFQNAVIQAAANIPITQWTQANISNQSVLYNTNNTNNDIYSAGISNLTYEGFIQYHYVFDARLGV